MNLYGDIEKLEKNRKSLRRLLVIRQIIKWMVIASIVLMLTIFILFLGFALYLILVVRDIPEINDMIMKTPPFLRKIDSMHISGNLLLAVWGGFVFIDIVFLMIYAKKNEDFRNLYKETFVTPIIGEFFDDFQYNYKEGFDLSKVQAFSLVKNGTEVISEDYLSGSYREVKFEQAEVVVKNNINAFLTIGAGNGLGLFSWFRNTLSARTVNRKTRVGKRKDSAKTYFSGQMMTFSFPKERIQSLHVFSNNYKNRPNLDTYSSKTVKMEDVSFNESFDVLTANEHDAFYVLTPHMQERMKKLLKRFESIAFYFKGNTLYVGFNSQNDVFDTDIRKPISYPKERQKVHDDLKIIKDIIDIMLMRQQD